jgi:hypothetical protein
MEADFAIRFSGPSSTPQHLASFQNSYLGVVACGAVTRPCNGNHDANVRLLKLSGLMSIQVANFRNVCEISELCSGIRSSVARKRVPRASAGARVTEALH